MHGQRDSSRVVEGNHLVIVSRMLALGTMAEIFATEPDPFLGECIISTRTRFSELVHHSITADGRGGTRATIAANLLGGLQRLLGLE